MHSGKILGALGAVLCFCLMFSLAVPRKARPGEELSARGPASGAAPTEPVHRRSPGAARASGPVPPVESSDPLRDGSWCPEGYGFCLPAPAGWSAGRRRSQAWLRKDPAQPDSGGLSVQKLPNVFGRDLPALMLEQRSEMESNPERVLHSFERLEAGGRELLRADYSCRPAGGAPTRCVAWTWLAGPMQVMLTFTVAEAGWPGVEAELRRSMEGLRFGPRHP